MGYLGNNLQAAYSSYLLIDSISSSFNGTTTSFPLRVNGVTPVPFPLNEQNVLISVGGVPQKPDASGAEGFKFSGSNIVFSSAPKTGEAFWGVVLAGADYVNAGTTYPDGSVSVPSITFGSEKTTGFYRPASGSIAVALNGVLGATFTSNGLNLYNATGGFTAVASSSSAGNNTITLPVSNGAAYQIVRNGATPGTLEFGGAIVSGTAVNSTSGTSIDFTGIPSWAKRVTVMFSGVSTNGTSIVQVQIGAGSVSTSGYSSTASFGGSIASQYAGASSGFILEPSQVAIASTVRSGALHLMLIGGNTWVATGAIGTGTAGLVTSACAGNSPVLSSTLDRIRITTVNGTDTFDAGSINILYE